jgi:hypothetical protein
LGLDPKKSHRSLSKDGKLKNVSSKKKKDLNLKPGFVFVPAQEESTKVETLKQEKLTEIVDVSPRVENEKATITTNASLKEKEADAESAILEEKVEVNFSTDKSVDEQSEKQKKKQLFQKKSLSNNS